jgi:hypothetical protein
VYAGVVITTEIIFVTVALGLGMFIQAIFYLAAGSAFVAGRINGKGERWRYLMQLSGIELAQRAFNIAKSSPSSINSAYAYDWNGKERYDMQTTELSKDEDGLENESEEDDDCVSEDTGDALSAKVQSGVEPLGPKSS